MRECRIGLLWHTVPELRTAHTAHVCAPAARNPAARMLIAALTSLSVTNRQKLKR